eukprot:SAG31_NODE_13373_length_874_cov_0.864516_1_plen_146_part_10
MSTNGGGGRAVDDGSSEKDAYHGGPIERRPCDTIVEAEKHTSSSHWQEWMDPTTQNSSDRTRIVQSTEGSEPSRGSGRDKGDILSASAARTQTAAGGPTKVYPPASRPKSAAAATARWANRSPLTVDVRNLEKTAARIQMQMRIV